MGVVNPAEPIAVGDVVIHRMPPLRQRPRRNDAFVIMQLSPTGLTPRRGIHRQSGPKQKKRTKKIIWISWLANQSRFVTRGCVDNLDLLKKSPGTKILLKKAQTHKKSNYGRHPLLSFFALVYRKKAR